MAECATAAKILTRFLAMPLEAIVPSKAVILPEPRTIEVLLSTITKVWTYVFLIDREIYFLYLPEKFYRVAGALEYLLRRAPLGGQYAVFARLN
jgi:hypothetical protein